VAVSYNASIMGVCFKKQVAQLWQRPCYLGDFKGVSQFEAKF